MKVRTIALGRPREVPGPRPGETTSTAIWKEPVDGPVEVGPENLVGDEQADRKNHGGPEKAVYAYGEEDLAWWRAELGDVDDLVFGQNLTTVGYDLRDARIGERWRIGTAELEVVQPRIPCFKLGLRAGDPTMPRRFVAADRPGVYLRVVTTGTITAGDALSVTQRQDDAPTVTDVFTIYHHERHRAARLLDAPGLPSWYHDWARKRLVSRD
ncbi:MOSC domain-containing protein YiiM [Actinomycetospora succinea]|uniref:MOSC domain-containing protein YiiM n=1 Tax=Actinomycetospora succinea TaxID=663603 RepID=A0A4R6VHK6_9PSEU|nr:MOSC domain-containing protein [Actinomycetospora succinea]TDQ62707.1 MOSC domain-containing protein YiiM [Actinomycetospora succinea]